jgi:hypothetical protein
MTDSITDDQVFEDYENGLPRIFRWQGQSYVCHIVRYTMARLAKEGGKP